MGAVLKRSTVTTGTLDNQGRLVLPTIGSHTWVRLTQGSPWESNAYERPISHRGLRRGERRLLELGVLSVYHVGNQPNETSSDQPAIGVVIPTLPSSLQDALALAQRLSRFSRALQIVVVIDGEVTTPPEAVLEDYPPIELLYLPHRSGPGRARNIGALHLNTDLVVFIDADMDIDEDNLTALLAGIESTDVALCAPRVHQGPVASSLERSAFPLDLGATPFGVSPLRPYIPSALMVLRRSEFLAIGGFKEDLRLGEDVDLCQRLLQRGLLALYLSHVHALHQPVPELSAKFRRSFLYGLSYAELHQRYPQTIRIFNRWSPTTLALTALAFVGPKGLGVRLALDVVSVMNSVTKAVAPATKMRQRWLRKTAYRAIKEDREHLLSNLLVPLMVASLVSKGCRRVLGFLILWEVGETLVRSEEPTRDLSEMMVGRCGYSVGLWLGMVLR